MAAPPIPDINTFNRFLDNDFISSCEIGYYSPEEASSLIGDIHTIKNISLIHVNIRSLNSNYLKLIELLSSYNKQFDLIILSEIWTTNINYFNNLFPEYTFLYSIPSFQKAGGIGILIKKSLSYNIIDSSNESTYYKHLAENMTIDITNKNGNFRLYLFYRHPRSCMREFIDLFINYFSVHKPKKKSFIIGDVNVDLQKYDSDNLVQKYLNELVNMNFLPFSIPPTHCGANFATLLDHVFANFGYSDSKQVSIKSLTVVSDITNHFANVAIITSKKNRVNFSVRPMIRIYSSKNINNFQNDLARTDWTSINNCISLDDGIATLTNTLSDLSDKHFPLTRCSRKNFKDKCWINKELKEYISVKNNLFFKFKETKNKADEVAYKLYKKELDRKLNLHRDLYFQNIMDARFNSIKSIWKSINSICCYKNDNRPKVNVNHIVSNQGPINDSQEIANHFNDYFSSIGDTLASKIVSTSNGFKKFLSSHNLNSIF